MFIREEDQADVYRSLIKAIFKKDADQVEVSRLIDHHCKNNPFNLASAISGTFQSPEFSGAPLITLVSKTIAAQSALPKTLYDCIFISLGRIVPLAGS